MVSLFSLSLAWPAHSPAIPGELHLSSLPHAGILSSALGSTSRNDERILEIVGRGVCRNYYKGHTDKIKGEGGGRGGRWVRVGWGGGMGRKCR